MTTNDKIKHFVTLTNQYTKKPCAEFKGQLDRVMSDYSISPVDRPNSYGARTYTCGGTRFRTFRGKLVTGALSNLVFYKIIEEEQAKPEIADWTGISM